MLASLDTATQLEACQLQVCSNIAEAVEQSLGSHTVTNTACREDFKPRIINERA